VRVRRLDEIGRLGAAFNQMAQELQAKHGALVARTEELALLNVELQRALEEARGAAVLKSQFVATISHELRTPLTGIIGYAEMLEMGLYGPLDEQLVEPIERISHSGHNLLQIINDLLDFSRLEAGKLDLREEPFAISDLLAQIKGTCAPLAQAKGLVLNEEFAASPLPLIWGDAPRLRQVMLNLLSNAIKFTKLGTITLSVKAKPATTADTIIASLAPGHFGVPLSGRHPPIEDWVVISVRDTGYGIAPEDQQLIFEEFRQVDGGYNRMVGGTGLGLAITKRLVALMSGAIHVASSPGSGSTFTVILPLKGVDAAAALEQLQRER
jgi:signal transduction histidine kinase